MVTPGLRGAGVAPCWLLPVRFTVYLFCLFISCPLSRPAGCTRKMVVACFKIVRLRDGCTVRLFPCDCTFPAAWSCALLAAPRKLITLLVTAPSPAALGEHLPPARCFLPGVAPCWLHPANGVVKKKMHCTTVTRWPHLGFPFSRVGLPWVPRLFLAHGTCQAS